nr:hypothetical protein [Halorarius halobius]
MRRPARYALTATADLGTSLGALAYATVLTGMVVVFRRTARLE